MKAALAICPIVALCCAAGLSAVIADAVEGDPMRFGCVLILMIGMAMYFGKKFVDWASGP